MKRVVAMLRSVNIGKRQLPMQILREGLEHAGCRDVVTYVQSGNVVLTPPPGAPRQLAPWLEEVVGTIAGFAVPVVVRTASEMAGVVARNPYSRADSARVYVMFYAAAPRDHALRDIDLAGFPPEHGTLVERDLYLQLPDGMGRALLPAVLERAAKRQPPTVATTRNWNTVLKLVELSRA